MNLVKQIKEVFEQEPSNLDEIRNLLSLRELTREELAVLAISFTDDCFCEYRDALDPEVESVTIENMHSNYIIEAINILLEFGLDPNAIFDNDNVLWNAMWIDSPNIAASLMRLLLENGGDPNHFIPAEHDTLFEYIAFKVSYDEYTHNYYHTVQCWLVLMAYGACWRNGEIPLTMLGNKSVEIFKEFEQFDYEIEPLPQEPGKYGCWIMHIFNIHTREEVARCG